MPELTPEEWQYISVLIAADVRADLARGFKALPERHRMTWEKIQPLCEWAYEEEDEQ